MDAETNQPQKVTGIGGVFFMSENPKELKAWYGQHLGLPINDYGATFEFRNNDGTQASLTWSAFPATTKYFAPSPKAFMVNYRVANLEALVAELKAAGVQVLDEIETYDYGKFVHILDPEQNKIELWEPIESAEEGDATK